MAEACAPDRTIAARSSTLVGGETAGQRETETQNEGVLTVSGCDISVCRAHSPHPVQKRVAKRTQTRATSERIDPDFLLERGPRSLSDLFDSSLHARTPRPINIPLYSSRRDRISAVMYPNSPDSLFSSEESGPRPARTTMTNHPRTRAPAPNRENRRRTTR